MRHLEYVKAQSRTPCDCDDCDGEWCTWCFTHHGLKKCPVLKEAKEESLRVVKP